MTEELMPKIYSKRKGAPDPVPKDAVDVSRGTPYGNPFRMQGERERAGVIELFRNYADQRLAEEPAWLDPLRGKDLVCYCQSPSDEAKRACHAEYLMQLANR